MTSIRDSKSELVNAMHMDANSVSTSESTEQFNSKSTSCCSCFARRYVFAVMGFAGMAISFTMRLNITVAIVAMVNSTSSSSTATNSNASNSQISRTCPAPPSYFSTSGGSKNSGTFAWDEQTQAIVLGAYMFGYIISLIPSGYCAVKFGGKKMYLSGVICMSIFTLVSPMAAQANVGLFAICRCLTGFVSSTINPSMHTMIAKWAPPAERSKISAFVYAGCQIGSVVGTIVTGLLCDSNFLGGWPSAFYVFGIVGIIWSLLAMVIMYESPSVHPSISEEERNYITGSLGQSLQKKVTQIPWKAIFTSSPVWAIVIAQVGQSWLAFTLVSELPTFFNTVYQFNTTVTSFLSAIPFMTAWICSTAFSFLADYLRRNNILSPTMTRKVFQVISQAAPVITCVCLATMGCNYVAAILLFVMGLGLNGVIFSAYYTNSIDLSPNFAGTLLSISSTFGNISQVVAPIIVGHILNGNSSLCQWRIVYLICGALLVCTTIVYLVFGTAKEQEWNRISSQNPGKGEENPDEVESALASLSSFHVTFINIE